MVEDLSDEPTEPIEVGQATTYGELAEAFDAVEAFLLGAEPTLTRVEVAARAGVPLALAEQLWKWLGFPHAADDDVAFAQSDVEALQMTADLMRMGILSEDSQAALVRTWGRSYARLAEWQTSLLAGIAIEGPDPDLRMAELAAGVLPRVEALQTYIWRRHLASAASRLMTTAASPDRPQQPMAVCFVDIVGYTSRSKNLSEHELVEMIERFEQKGTDVVVEGGGRVIKTIGDEVLFTADDAVVAAEIALTLTALGDDRDDPFPEVRAGLAYGDVVARLGDVFGPTVNIASRLTSIAKPGTVVVDRGVHDRLCGATVEQPAADLPADREPDAEADESGSAYSFRRLRRVTVKGYSRLEAWALRRSKERLQREEAESAQALDETLDKEPALDPAAPRQGPPGM